MRALGYNLVRLVLNWSQLEPNAGVYNTTYLDRIARVVRLGQQQGIYVILDMHQDQYSRYILPGTKDLPSGCPSSGGSDGRPGNQAIFTDGKPAVRFRSRCTEPGGGGGQSQFLAKPSVPAPLGHPRVPDYRITTSELWPHWPGASRTIPPCWAMS